MDWLAPFFWSNSRELIFLAIALFIAMVVFHFIRVTKWPWVNGELIEGFAESYSWFGKTRFRPRFRYQYTVDGVSYEGRRLSPMAYSGMESKMPLTLQIKKIHRNSDGTVRVFYNPKKPKKSYLVNGSQTSSRSKPRKTKK